MASEHMITVVRRYFELLTASDFEGILALFEPDATVESPFLGRVPVRPFFEKLARASSESRLTVFDILVGEQGETAAAHFEYDWTLGNGDRVVFRGFDHFTFAKSGRVAALLIVYDTYPVREDVGDKYANA